MIKVDIKSDVLEVTKHGVNLRMDCALKAEGKEAILEEELYRLCKELEERIPNVWINALERVMLDRIEKHCGMEGDDEE